MRFRPPRHRIDNIYTEAYSGQVAEAIEFDWDEQNRTHLQSHHVAPEEFEQVIDNDPLDLEYQVENGEGRYKSLGVTNNGRVLIAVWTHREGKVRAITAYRAGKSYERLYGEIRG